MATVEGSARPVRGRKLNTIMEDYEATTFGGKGESESETDGSESTVVGKPIPGSRLYTVTPKRSSNLRSSASPGSPVSENTTPASSAGSGIHRGSTRSSFADSDDGTVFSESCPSLSSVTMSDTTTFYTDSARSSLVVQEVGKNKYPSLLIPQRASWNSMDDKLKEVPFGLSPGSKIPLSPEALSAIPSWAPILNRTPSLGATSSITCESPSIPAVSAPPTPDMRTVDVEDEDNWHHQHENQGHGIALEIPSESASLRPNPQRLSVVTSEAAWSDLVRGFPKIPGATPVEFSPMSPIHERMVHSLETPISERGVQLPDEAFQTLQKLVRDHSPSGTSETRQSETEEMREAVNPPSRPRSEVGITPLSEYSEHSFSELSIPSPGGFFASLGAGSRHTWSFLNTKYVAPPSSATAENFYNAPWNSPAPIRETVLELRDTTDTEGPPTVRQAQFGEVVKSKRSSHSDPQSETSDMYGAPSDNTVSDGTLTPGGKSEQLRYEYEEAYEEEIKHAAEVNMDRTSSWLAAQTTYMSALRETNPVNDLSDPSSIQHPSTQSQLQEHSETLAALVRTKSVRFDPATKSPHQQTLKEPITRDPVLLEALRHHIRQRKDRDSFIAASARLNLVHSMRITSPTDHVSKYLHGAVQIPQPSTSRPKYSGPFSQNPRQTCLLNQPPPPERVAYNTLEFQQSGLQTIQPHTWAVDALRYLNSGRLLASRDACERLSTHSTVPLTSPECVGRKRLRVLDLGGVPSAASWAWQVALHWPNVKVYSVLTKQQAKSARSVTTTSAGTSSSNFSMPHTINSSSSTPASSPLSTTGPEPRIEPPPNHRTTTVPHLWSLPFGTGTFDVVRAHSLYALLRSEPVPGVSKIDEFDLTLKEILRVLKPGGYLDFMVMDSGIKGAGALGDKMSVEFGFMLHRMGYERDLTRTWISRLSKAGFTGVKRAWWAAPLGKKLPVDEIGDFTSRDGGKTWKDAPRPISEVSVRKLLDEYCDVEAVRGPVGSTADVADVTGLLGSWMWESWIVKTREETASRTKAVISMSASDGTGAAAPTCDALDGSKLLEGIGEVLDEGRRVGSCWRLLSGFARKPTKAKGRPKKDGKPTATTTTTTTNTHVSAPAPQMEMKDRSTTSFLLSALRRSSFQAPVLPPPTTVPKPQPNHSLTLQRPTDPSDWATAEPMTARRVVPDFQLNCNHAPGAVVDDSVSPEEGTGTMGSWIGTGLRRDDSTTGTIKVQMDF